MSLLQDTTFLLSYPLTSSQPFSLFISFLSIISLSLSSPVSPLCKRVRAPGVSGKIGSVGGATQSSPDRGRPCNHREDETGKLLMDLAFSGILSASLISGRPPHATCVPQHTIVVYSMLQSVYHSIPQYISAYYIILQYTIAYYCIPQYITVRYNLFPQQLQERDAQLSSLQGELSEAAGNLETLTSQLHHTRQKADPLLVNSQLYQVTPEPVHLSILQYITVYLGSILQYILVVYHSISR